MKTLPLFIYSFPLTLLLLTTLSAMSQVQSLTDEIEEAVRAEVLEQHRLEQKAFIEGDCETVISFYDDEATIYRGGRRVEMPEILEFCKKVPRPFSSVGGPHISDSFYVLSENAAHFVRTIDLEPADDNPSSFKKEVITKVWFKTANGWKIVHFHSSLHSVKVK